MKKLSLLRVLSVLTACAALSLATGTVYAQRGGHGGGGGGFAHGGGGFAHGGGGFAHGGAGFGGGRFGGFRGGYGGYRGWGWGGRGWGWGWGGWGWGFGWNPYWWYPYGYYSPYWYAPDYPYYPPYGYGYPYPYPYNNEYNNRDGNRPPSAAPKSPDNSIRPPATPAPQSPQNPQNMNDYNNNGAPDLQTARLRAARGTTVAASDFRTTQPPRREVQNAIRAVNEMPQYAFQRRIDSGRYSDFSPEEQQLVSSASPYPLEWERR